MSRRCFVRERIKPDGVDVGVVESQHAHGAPGASSSVRVDRAAVAPRWARAGEFCGTSPTYPPVDQRDGVSDYEARSACLAAIVVELQTRRRRRLVIESRQDDGDDERLISSVRVPDPRLVFEHQPGR